MRPFPKNTAQALRHFSTIEVDRTPLVDVFCVGRSFSDIRRSYKKLAMLVHPDRVARIDPRGSAKCMSVLSRAFELAKIEVEYDEIISGGKKKKDFLIPAGLTFTRSITGSEELVREHESMEKKRQERLARQNAARKNAERGTRQGPKTDLNESDNNHKDCAGQGCNVEGEETRRSEQRSRKEEEEARRAAELRAAREEAERVARQTADREASHSRSNQGADQNEERDDSDGCGIQTDSEHARKSVHLDCEVERNEEGEDSSDTDDDSEERVQDDDYNPADYIVDEISGDEIEQEELSDPPFVGADISVPHSRHSKEPSSRPQPSLGGQTGPSIDARNRRRIQKKQSKQRAVERAKAALKAERVAAMTWKPRRCVPVNPVVGMCMDARWKCEQLIRAHSAYLAVQKGVNIHQTIVKVVMKCRVKTCNATLVFDLQPKNGNWKLNKYLQHSNDCFGQQVPVAGSSPTRRRTEEQFCAPAYTAQQVARAVIEETCNEPNINTKTISAIVKAKGIYLRQPPVTHYRAIRRELLRHLCTSRAVNMAALDGYAQLLRDMGHKVDVIIINGLEMKQQRLKAAKHIFAQCKKAKSIPDDEVFNEDVVDYSDIDDNGRYYGGFVFVPSVASHICATGRMTASADAAHCDGIGPQSYGTTFEVVSYDANNHLFPLVFAHFVGAECLETWTRVFQACAGIEGFDVPLRTTIVDQEKSIDSAYRACLKHAKLFLDPLHVKKNLGAKLGAEKASGLRSYERAVYAPSMETVGTITSTYSSVQREYLRRFDDAELYRSFSNLQDLTTTSQGAESQMAAALRNNIRSVEPQKMLTTVLLTQRSNFLKRQAAALSCDNPVPPYVEKHLAQLISKARPYQPSVTFLPGTSQMEATVRSQTDGSVVRRVVLSRETHKPPSCCSYATSGSGFPCLHGVGVLSEKHGSSNLYKFIEKRHLTHAWRKQYENVSFSLPHQSSVDDVMIAAKKMVVSGNNLQVPKAIPPPRGRPVKHAGKRRKGWYERGPTARKRRSYSCSLCHLEGHLANVCPLRQIFDGNED